MNKDGWKFPITFSRGRGSEWVHPRAKIHYFRNNETLCKKWSQWDNYDSFEYDLVKELVDKRVCKECWKKYKEELEKWGHL